MKIDKHILLTTPQLIFLELFFFPWCTHISKHTLIMSFFLPVNVDHLRTHLSPLQAIASAQRMTLALLLWTSCMPTLKTLGRTCARPPTPLARQSPHAASGWRVSWRWPGVFTAASSTLGMLPSSAFPGTPLTIKLSSSYLLLLLPCPLTHQYSLPHTLKI